MEPNELTPEERKKVRSDFDRRFLCRHLWISRRLTKEAFYTHVDRLIREYEKQITQSKQEGR